MSEKSNPSYPAPLSDAALTTRLRQWKDIEPQAAFEADVWRRIRYSPPLQVATTPGWGVPLWRSILLRAAAVLAAVWIGVAAGKARAPAPPPPIGHLQWLASGTLSGDYVQWLTGAIPYE